MKKTDYLLEHEKVILSLRKLYSSYGYARYVMSKFENYDLYSGNRDYLVSDRIMTFTDTDGSLKALKPDITLSIIKNLADDRKQNKLYYNENVYRPSRNNGTFREINQLGLEIIGSVDTYETGEVLDLALGSLSLMSKDTILDIADIDITYALMDRATSDPEIRKHIIKAVSGRNTGELMLLKGSSDVDGAYIDSLISLLDIYGLLGENLGIIEEILADAGLSGLYDSFLSKISLVKDRNINVDFSMVSDGNYYNGIIFRGYIREAKQVVLQGGEYRNLLEKMGKKASGIGFAVYADVLREIEDRSMKVDILAVYTEDSVLSAFEDKVRRLREQGKSVFVSNTPDVNVRYRKLLRL